MHRLHMVLEMVEASQEVSQMLALRMTANKSGSVRFMPQMDLLNVVHHMGNTIEGAHAVHVRQLLVSNTIDALRLAQYEWDLLQFWQGFNIGRSLPTFTLKWR